jgi:hypothetical protein
MILSFGKRANSGNQVRVRIEVFYEGIGCVTCIQFVFLSDEALKSSVLYGDH